MGNSINGHLSENFVTFSIINHNSNETFLARYICDYCSDLIHSIVVKEAIKRNIPYVLFGYSPDQIFRYFYEMPHEEVMKECLYLTVLGSYPSAE